MPNITFTILGTPIGFDCIPTDRSQYYRQYYDGSTVPEKLVIERNKSRIDYVYLRYGLFSSGGRSGSFIGLALSFEGEYCSTPLLLAELLRSLYAQLLKIGVITQSKTSKGEDLIQYSRQYAQFSTLDSYVKKMTSWLNQELREGEAFKGSILPLDASFQGGENAQSMKVLRWDDETSAEGIVNAMRRYPYMELRPDATGIEVKLTPEDRLWLANYKTYLEGKKSIKDLDSQVKAIEFESSQYTLRKDAYKTKVEHIGHLERILAMIKGASVGLSEVTRSIQEEGVRIARLREELKKIGDASVAKEAEESNNDQTIKCKELSSFLMRTEETMQILLEKYSKSDPRPNPRARTHSKPTPNPKPQPQPHDPKEGGDVDGGDDPDPVPRQSFFSRALEWMVSHKKGSLYTLLILLFVGFGGYTYLQFFPKEGSTGSKELQERFDTQKKEIENAIETLDFPLAKAKLHSLAQDTSFSKHFSNDIKDLEKKYQTAGNEYYEPRFQAVLDSIQKGNVSDIEVLVKTYMKNLQSYEAFAFKNENRNFRNDIENSVRTYGDNEIKNPGGDMATKYNWIDKLVRCAKLIRMDSTTWVIERDTYKSAPPSNGTEVFLEKNGQGNTGFQEESNVEGLPK